MAANIEQSRTEHIFIDIKLGPHASCSKRPQYVNNQVTDHLPPGTTHATEV